MLRVYCVLFISLSITYIVTAFPSNVELYEKLQALEEKVKTLESKQNSNVVAFSATTDATMYYENGDIVQFPTVITNTGNFDPATGIFVCPVSGIYQFNFSLLSGNPGGVIRAGIFKDGFQQARGYGVSFDTIDTAVQNVVLNCDQGQTVWVEIIKVSGEVLSVHGGEYSTFSGLFIQLAPEV